MNFFDNIKPQIQKTFSSQTFNSKSSLIAANTAAARSSNLTYRAFSIILYKEGGTTFPLHDYLIWLRLEESWGQGKRKRSKKIQSLQVNGKVPK
jgi:hypothetical protein